MSKFVMREKYINSLNLIWENANKKQVKIIAREIQIIDLFCSDSFTFIQITASETAAVHENSNVFSIELESVCLVSCLPEISQKMITTKTKK